jgi:hypothetical protein
MSRIRRESLTLKERLKLLDRFKRKSEVDERKKRLYNRIYRKSPLFIFSWIIRSSFLILFIITFLYHYTTTDTKREVVQNQNIETYYVRTNKYGGQRRVTDLHLKTTNNEYVVNLNGITIPLISNGDTIIIDNNYLGKAIYITKENWDWKYGLPINFGWYFVVFFITFLSTFFNNGLDRFTTKLIMVTSSLDLLTLFLYVFF